MYCNGEEYCDVKLGCGVGIPPMIDDGIGCTIDNCDEKNDIITHILSFYE